MDLMLLQRWTVKKKRPFYSIFICTNCSARSEYSECSIARCDRNKLLKYWKISANYYDGRYYRSFGAAEGRLCVSEQYQNNNIYQTCIISSANNRPPADPKTFAMVRFGRIVVKNVNKGVRIDDSQIMYGQCSRKVDGIELSEIEWWMGIRMKIV